MKVHPQRITQKDKKLAEDLSYDEIDFPVQEKDFSKIETKNNSCENRLVFPTFASDQKFENSIDLLLITDGNKSNYVYIKDFKRFMFHKTKHKNNKYFCKTCLQCFSGQNI